jgi:GT2 family glycosyltransferase
MQPAAPFDLSVVLVNYNTRQLLLGCLASVYQSADRSALRLECIVIDNASADGSLEAVRAQFPQVRLIANPENLYFSAAYTQGVNLAAGRYIVAINSDMLIKGETLVQLVQQMEADPGIGAATTTMFFPDGRLQRNGARFTPYGYLLLNYTFLGKLFPGRLRAFNDWLWYRDWDRCTPRRIDVLPGSCIIAPQAVWQATGGFDARMLMYFSDDYLSRAVQKLGKQTVYLVSDGIVHYEGASAKQMSAWALRTYLRDLLVYTRLVYGRAAQIVLALLLIPTWIVMRRKLNRARQE